MKAPTQAAAASPWLLGDSAPQELSQVSLEDVPRILLPSQELNRVLGGGVVPGSVILMAGEPGIGKSTLLLQIAAALAERGNSSAPKDAGGDLLYISGEESAPQIRLRAERLGLSGQGLFLLGETHLQVILHWLDERRPAGVIVDSIQTLYSDTVPSGSGSVGQVRECARLLLGWAKAHRAPVFLAGHVTKEGDVAGPRVLEHLVDVVLYLEGEVLSPLRVLRSAKNRFGSTNEVALFQMESGGLAEVADPSFTLLSQRQGPLVGSAVVPLVEGSRPLLVEVQALTAPTHTPVPRRVVSGLEASRLVMLAAVLDRRAGLSLGGQDIFLNVAGGLRIDEPAADLAVALAVASSFRDTPLGEGVAVLGEVGLGGEIRLVSQLERRLREAARLGLRHAVAPRGTAETLPNDLEVEVMEVATLSEAIRVALPRGRRRSDAATADEAGAVEART